MPKISFLPLMSALLAACVLSACNPQYNWRDYHSPDAPYTVLFPGKPATLTRTIELAGASVSMTMTAAEIEGATFAVGSAEMADAQQAKAALSAMQTALLNNIGAQVSQVPHPADSPSLMEVEAAVIQNGTPIQLVGHLIAQDKRIYQVIVVSKGKPSTRENIDMFISSFKFN